MQVLLVGKKYSRTVGIWTMEYVYKAASVVEAADINVLVFRETPIKYLGSRKEKNKEKLKWLGTLIDFKDFTTLLLDEKGKGKHGSRTITPRTITPRTITPGQLPPGQLPP